MMLSASEFSEENSVSLSRASETIHEVKGLYPLQTISLDKKKNKHLLEEGKIGNVNVYPALPRRRPAPG
jgi:hypothetical protein